jgi:hypothetical protein
MLQGLSGLEFKARLAFTVCALSNEASQKNAFRNEF